LVVPPPAGEAREVEGLCVSLMNEAAADRAWPRVEILVAAPHGEIDVPIVQRERNIADRMRQIEAAGAAAAACAFRDRAHVQALTSQVLHARQPNQRELRGVTFDRLADELGLEQAFRR